MDTARLAELTVPSLEDCLRAADETRALALGEGALSELPRLIGEHHGPGRAFIVADGATWERAGQAVETLLRDSGLAPAGNLIFPASPRLHADYAHVETITRRFHSLWPSKGAELFPLAVGAGTINDLVKRAASELGLPYLCVPTAASVDGYTSSGAALLKGGFKQTLACAAPRTLAADPAILAEAPAYLSSSGFGDLAGKLTAGSDWIIAAKAGPLGAPGTEPIDPLAWSMTQTGLREALANSAEAVRGDRDAVQVLFRALALTGFAMQHLKSSRPVSGCEHLYSHVWEMENLEAEGNPVTHGHKVALGTLAAAAFTEQLFSRKDPPPPAPLWKRPGPKEREAEVRAAFKGSIPEAGAVKTALEKLLDERAAASLGTALRDQWRAIREEALERLPPYGELRALMARGGCPVRPAEINLTRERVIEASRRAQMIRNRYTVLDLAWDLGLFDQVLAEMESSPLYLY